ncbi:MAG: hypothetical protein Kow0077_31060 [Anaerolineae bacterium]
MHLTPDPAPARRAPTNSFGEIRIFSKLEQESRGFIPERLRRKYCNILPIRQAVSGPLPCCRYQKKDKEHPVHES